MSTLADKLAELVEAHNVSMCGNLGVPGMPDHLELKCPTCGPIADDGRYVFKQHATHGGNVIADYLREHFTDWAEELGLTREAKTLEDGYGGMTWDVKGNRLPTPSKPCTAVHRYVTDWTRDE